MRSIAEIRFRAKQEIGNLSLLWFQPSPENAIPYGLDLPEPQLIIGALSGSIFARSVTQIADQILARQFPLLGTTIAIPGNIQWRRDYAHQRISELRYFRRIPYLDFNSVGDHKFIWELNRHQHLVALAQAYLFTGRKEYRDEIFNQLESWFTQNPFQRGINWASALEVAFRALSWCWVYRLVGTEMPGTLRSRFLTELYRHGAHLELNLSIYFSPNTHLLGEAVVLYTLGKFFGHTRRGAAWESKAAAVIQTELSHQIQPDGSHFEQSSYYHVYALDFFLFFYLISGRPSNFEAALKRMAEYLHWLLGPQREIAFTGDDDGGRVFHPYGDRRRFGRATLFTCGLLFDQPEWIGTEADVGEQAAWWLSAENVGSIREVQSPRLQSRLFPDCGTAFLQAGEMYLQMDCGPFGFGGGGHSHSDTLSVLLTYRQERILMDPGTYTYVGDPAERSWFRGSLAHNTVRVDKMDQAKAEGPFRWSGKPEVKLNNWSPQGFGGIIDAICEYAGISHRRRVLLQDGYLLVLDELTGPGGEHTCEVVWQLGPGSRGFRFLSSLELKEVPSQYSPAYGCKLPATAVIGTVTGTFPICIATLLTMGEIGSITVPQAEYWFADFSEKS
jgi:Heparinase II/III-like protein/Heparinase II/III N-terminus